MNNIEPVKMEIVVDRSDHLFCHEIIEITPEIQAMDDTELWHLLAAIQLAQGKSCESTEALLFDIPMLSDPDNIYGRHPRLAERMAAVFLNHHEPNEAARVRFSAEVLTATLTKHLIAEDRLDAFSDFRGWLLKDLGQDRADQMLARRAETRMLEREPALVADPNATAGPSP